MTQSGIANTFQGCLYAVKDKWDSLYPLRTFNGDN